MSILFSDPRHLKSVVAPWQHQKLSRNQRDDIARFIERHVSPGIYGHVHRVYLFIDRLRRMNRYEKGYAISLLCKYGWTEERIYELRKALKPRGPGPVPVPGGI